MRLPDIKAISQFVLARCTWLQESCNSLIHCHCALEKGTKDLLYHQHCHAWHAMQGAVDKMSDAMVKQVSCRSRCMCRQHR